MKILYSRKTKISPEKIVENIQNKAKEFGFSFWGKTEIENTDFILAGIYSQKWVEKLGKKNSDLLGLVPFYIIVMKQEDKAKVGLLNPDIASQMMQPDDFAEFEKDFKGFVDAVSEAGERKVIKIKLYSTTSCPYCAAEKSFLESNNVDFEYILVDLNPAAAQEMVKKTGQMGVPVTEVVYDDNDTEYIIGFDKPTIEKIVQSLKKQKVDSEPNN